MTNKLYGILLRFREGRIAVTADIEAMLHQVFVKPTDRDVLRFLWWKNGDLYRKPTTYRMTVHLFGGIWSPSCAAFALQTTLDLHHHNPYTAMARRNFYVDDILLSTDEETAAESCISQLRAILLEGDFRLTKWASNS